MEHVLDNPIWNAMLTGNKDLVEGNGHAKYFNREIAIFAGMPEYNERNFSELYALTPINTRVILFTKQAVAIPAQWKVNVDREMLQMVYEGAYPDPEDLSGIVPMTDKDIPEMIKLTALTKPGPFFQRTINFGNYEGIYTGDQLIAMSGQRLRPDPYTEISAVCVHPDHLGKSYAKKLIRNQLRKMMDAGRIPFLHLFSDNTPARTLYETLGFKTRSTMRVYMMEK